MKYLKYLTGALTVALFYFVVWIAETRDVEMWYHVPNVILATLTFIGSLITTGYLIDKGCSSE